MTRSRKASKAGGRQPIPLAIAHDYLTQRGGAEQVVLAMARQFPGVPIYTTFYEPSQTYAEFGDVEVITSRFNRIGFLRRNPKRALLLLPFLVLARRIPAERILVSSSGWAHGFRATGTKLVYCYTPARWLYQTRTYLNGCPRAVAVALKVLRPLLIAWDRRMARTCERYFAISSVVRERIEGCYHRDSVVIPAPVRKMQQAVGFDEDSTDREDYFLCVSRLNAYKNVRQLVEAFRGADEHLVIVGDGPLREELDRTRPPNVTLMQGISDDQLADLYANARGLLAVAYEDFGLTPLEAAQFGVPTLALRWGGYLDTIDEGVTGVFVDEPTPEQIRRGLGKLADLDVDATALRTHASMFFEDRFFARLGHLLELPPIDEVVIDSEFTSLEEVQVS